MQIIFFPVSLREKSINPRMYESMYRVYSLNHTNTFVLFHPELILCHPEPVSGSRDSESRTGRHSGDNLESVL